MFRTEARPRPEQEARPNSLLCGFHKISFF